MRALVALLIAALLPAPVFAQDDRPLPRPEEARPEPAPKPVPPPAPPADRDEKAKEQADPPPAPPSEAKESPPPPVASEATPPRDAPKADPAQSMPSDPASKDPADTPAPAEAAPVKPAGPPLHASLREDDFTYSACLLDLTLMGASYEERPAVTDSADPDCGIDRPIQLTSPLPGVEIDGGALMRCDTARHLARWLRDFVRPSAALLPGQPRLVGLVPGSTYQCRATVGNASEKLSEHALGNAFDIAAFRFADGSKVEIAPRQDDGDLTEAFQHAVRGTACLHFSTVLGPGANAAHDNHLHLDIKARKGGFRLCQ